MYLRRVYDVPTYLTCKQQFRHLDVASNEQNDLSDVELCASRNIGASSDPHHLGQIRGVGQLLSTYLLVYIV